MRQGDNPKILIVDPDRRVREAVAHALRHAGYGNISQAAGTETARELLDTRGPFALVVLEVSMEHGGGLELLAELTPKAPQTVLVVVTTAHGLMTAIECLKRGAYDYVLKPIDEETIRLAVGLALKRRSRELEERASREQLHELVERRVGTLEKTRSALLRAICRVAEFGEPGGPVHAERVAEYSHLLAEQLGRHSPYAAQIDDQFLTNIYESALLHDIGKVSLPEELLRKQGELTEQERQLVRGHATKGRGICRAVQKELGQGEDALIQMAAEVTAHHHERWDGGGYPEGLRGSEIPLASRIVALADYYDIWRTPMAYRPEVLPRVEVKERILERYGTRFDPAVVDAFKLRQKDFRRVEEEWSR
ncbi:MAG: response regulator [Candidatus Brocadiia bacterium]